MNLEVEKRVSNLIGRLGKDVRWGDDHLAYEEKDSNLQAVSKTYSCTSTMPGMSSAFPVDSSVLQGLELWRLHKDILTPQRALQNRSDEGQCGPEFET